MSLDLDLHCTGQQGFQLQLQSSIADQGVTALYGPSGSGKSTLLDCIAGLREPGDGSQISFRGQQWLGHGQAVPVWRRRIGYVFQDARLFPHLTVAGNLDYASQRARGRPALERDRLQALLGIDELLPQKPDTLSAGQQQRVAIGRALCSAPQLLLLDEPLANLDPMASAECLTLLQEIANQVDLPMIYVSHDIEELGQLADDLLLLQKGKLVDSGPMMEMSSRLDTQLAHEEQAAAIVSGHIKAQDTHFGLTEIEVEEQVLYVNLLPQAPGSSRRLRIPARDVSICRERPAQSSILNILPVTIAEITTSGGAQLMLRLALGKQFLLARITRKSAERLQLAPGDRVFAQIKSVALLSEAGDAV
ncbi:molybdenum ABC transporter ATP-binding protein [Pseudohalioglobus sediminis]|uniref:Molybdenum ABC transporter ATP-binding protein n=1 Tax=Pseudohalioglobus sediminis TaxID=2606449 RepID=A0A5B0WW75_9GAMM|nr:molybdenum ABC transporter ATP-binding protein [Pseudohalioglobus sediminis]KAA1190648.1 molybdenum ABC transporter ATP-binding protein [Pseudohalioglobus sediminis]